MSRLRPVAAVAVVVLLLGCGSADEPAAPTPTLPSSTQAFLPGLDATVVLPPEPGAAVPVIVLVPGGSWASADPGGLVPLADDLAGRGAAVVMITYRTAADEAYFPIPAQDVACGVAHAASTVAAAGLETSDVVVVGHSSGAQLAALVALDPEGFADPGCPHGSVAPDALVGLAGPYDVTQFSGVAANLFGPDRPDPQTWDDGNPLTLADQRPDLPVLLVHGAADDLVPMSFTEDFAAALRAGDHDVTTEYPEGVTHETVYSAEVAAPIIGEWLGLAPSPTPSEDT